MRLKSLCPGSLFHSVYLTWKEKYLKYEIEMFDALRDHELSQAWKEKYLKYEIEMRRLWIHQYHLLAPWKEKYLKYEIEIY